MKKVAFLFLLPLFFFSNGFAQKSIVKKRESQVTASQDSTNKDSLRGKAAIRGSANMMAARDSLRAANFEPPVEVNDTFEVIKAYRTGMTRLREDQILTAEVRLQEIRELLEKATESLEAARKNENVSKARIDELEAKIGEEMVRLEASEARIKAIRQDWEAKTGFKDAETKEPSEKE